SESSRSDSRVSAPIRRKPSSSRMYASPGIALMSMTCLGVARRSFISGIRLWPPDSTLASSPSLASSCVASPIDVGAWYSKAAGIIGGPLGSAGLKGSCRTVSLSLSVERRTPRSDTHTFGVHTRGLRSSDGSCRCFDGASREDLEQMALVLFGALEVGLDVDCVGRLLRRGLEGVGVEGL